MIVFLQKGSSLILQKSIEVHSNDNLFRNHYFKENLRGVFKVLWQLCQVCSSVVVNTSQLSLRRLNYCFILCFSGWLPRTLPWVIVLWRWTSGCTSVQCPGIKFTCSAVNSTVSLRSSPLLWSGAQVPALQSLGTTVGTSLQSSIVSTILILIWQLQPAIFIFKSSLELFLHVTTSQTTSCSVWIFYSFWDFKFDISSQESGGV